MRDVASVLRVVYHAAHAAVDSTLLTQVSAVVFVVDVGEGAVAAAGGEGGAAVVCTADGQVGGAVAVDGAVVVLLTGAEGGWCSASDHCAHPVLPQGHQDPCYCSGHMEASQKGGRHHCIHHHCPGGFPQYVVHS